MTPIENIIEAAARTVYLKPSDITGKSKASYVVSARRAVAYIAKEQGYSYTDIGKALGGRDHSTIAFGQEASGKKLATSAGFRELVSFVRRNIK